MTTQALPRVMTRILCKAIRKRGSRAGEPCLNVLMEAVSEDFSEPFKIQCSRCGEIASFGPLT